jgi:putative membrane protein
MINRMLALAAFTTVLGVTQIPHAPGTNPKPVTDPLNTNNLNGDNTIVPGASQPIPGGNPGLTTNPVAGISDQMREAADQIFATAVAQQTMTRIELGKLAAGDASGEAVKAYAAQMIIDNAKVNARLKRVAARGGVTIPANIDAKNQSRIDKLAKLRGDEFDRAFVKDQIQSGEKNLRSYEQVLQQGADPGLKMLATHALPAMQKQLQSAKDLEKTLKVK